MGDGVVDAEFAAAQEMHCLSQAERLLDGAISDPTALYRSAWLHAGFQSRA